MQWEQKSFRNFKKYHCSIFLKLENALFQFPNKIDLKHFKMSGIFVVTPAKHLRPSDVGAESFATLHTLSRV